MLRLIDEFTRESLPICVARKLKAADPVCAGTRRDLRTREIPTTTPGLSE